MPKATTARTTRSDRMPYRNSRSRRLDTGRSGLLLVIPSRSSLGGGEHAPEGPDELGEFEREDEFRRGASAERLESVQVLQHQRLLVDPFRGSEDRQEGLRVSFRVQDRGLSCTFRAEDRGLLVPFRDRDRGGLPPPRRPAACFPPSAIVPGAFSPPSASMPTPRRLRSADIWRIIASVTFLGGRISRISTFVTLTPQRVVTSSSFVRKIALISSRFDSTSSRMMSPTTARSVVVAIPIAAPSKLFTRITESAALATLKYTMKSTSTGALSFVMHVWCGIVRNRSRKSTRTGLSIPGITTTIPGPFSAWAFPSRKFTIRSYSLTTLRLAKSRIRMMITKMNAPTAAPTRSAPCSAVTEPRSRRLTNTPIPLPRGRKLAPRFKAIVGLPEPDLCPD